MAGRLACGLAGKPFPILRKAGDEPTVAQEELVVLDPHEAIETVFFAGRIVAETSRGDRVPVSIVGAVPTVPVESFARQVSAFADKVLAEAMQAAQSTTLLGCVPSRDQHPGLVDGMKPVTGKGGVRRVGRRGRHQELLHRSGFPEELEMAVAAGPLIAEVPREDVAAFVDQAYAILCSDLVPVDRFLAAIPNAEDDPSFGETVDLHAEVPAMPPAGHVERAGGILDGGDFVVERFDLGARFDRVHQVHGGCVAAFLEIEVRALGGWTLQLQFRDAERGGLVLLAQFQRNRHIARFRKRPLTKVVGGFALNDRAGLARALYTGDGHGQFRRKFGGYDQSNAGTKQPCFLELAVPNHALLGVFPSRDADAFVDAGSVGIGQHVCREGRYAQRFRGVHGNGLCGQSLLVCYRDKKGQPCGPKTTESIQHGKAPRKK